MMARIRWFFAYLFVFGFQLQAQPPVFIPIPLLCDTVDSAEVFQHAPMVNVKYRNMVTYSSADGAMLAFKMAKSNQWLTTLLPFQNPTNQFEPVLIKGIANTCWVIDGSTLEYGTGSGTGIQSMMVIQIEDAPTCLFMADYACWEEDFGDRSNAGAGAYSRKYGYDLNFKEGLLHVKLLKQNHAAWCSLTPLHSGAFHWTEKGFRIPTGSVNSARIKSKKGVHKKRSVIKSRRKRR